jgi:hypothetical protein
MATKTEANAENVKKEIAADTAKAVQESSYSIDELVNSGVLGTKPITAKTALRLANKAEFTVKEAKEVIAAFKKEAK